LTFWWFPRR